MVSFFSSSYTKQQTFPLSGCRYVHGFPRCKVICSTVSINTANQTLSLVDCCKSTTDVASRQRLHSPSRHHLIMPRHRYTKFNRQAFSVAGPTAWNQQPHYLGDLSLSKDTFWQSLKTYLFALN